MLHGDALQSVSLGGQGRGPAPDYGEAIDVEAILRFLRRRYRLWLAWLLAGVVLGIGYAVVFPPAYTVTAAVLLQDPTPRMAGDNAVAQSDGAHSTFIETQIQVLASNDVMGRVVDGLDLIESPEFGRNAVGLRTWFTGQMRSLLGTPPPEHDYRQETIVRVRRALALHRVGMSDVLEIQFTSHDPALAAAFTGAVIRGYIDRRVAEQESAQRSLAEQDWKLLAELRNKAFPVAPPGESIASSGAPGPQARALFLEEQQRTDTYRTLYARLLQRALGSFDTQSLLPGLQVITPPAQPLVASSRLIGVIALIGGCSILGLGHALLREATDDVLRTAQDLQGFGEIGRVTVIPQLSQAELRPDRSTRGNAQPSYRAGCLPLLEAVGNMAAAMFEASSRRSRRLIGVVSPDDGAGTSLIAAQLAKVLADAGSRTCLVDANWRLPPIDGSPPGDLRYGALAGWMEKDGLTTGLDLVTLRTAAPVSGMAALLSILAALDSVLAEHPWVVVDFHSLAVTVDMAAAVNLLDQVVVVVQAQSTTRAGLRDLLSIVPATKLAAVVVNKAKVKRKRAKAPRTVSRGSKVVAAGRRVKSILWYKLRAR